MLSCAQVRHCPPYNSNRATERQRERERKEEKSQKEFELARVVVVRAHIESERYLFHQ